MSNTTSNSNVSGTENDDVIETAAGNDHIDARGGEDYVRGGLGNDFIEGGEGDDHLIGDSPAQHLDSIGLITIQDDHDVSVTFESEGAGYQSAFGYYKVDGDTGEISDVEIIWSNASAVGSGGELEGGVTTADIPTEAGDQIGFFLVANGGAMVEALDTGEGGFEFRNQSGEQASITDENPGLFFVDGNGEASQVNQNIYHSAAYGETAALNPDEELHTVGLLSTGDGVLAMGFEDLLHGGDRDFDDIVFSVDLGESTASVLNAHYEQRQAETTETISEVADGSAFNPETTADRIHGEQGSDLMEGMQGNDLLVGDRAGEEWSLVDGEWVYDASKQAEPGDNQDTHDDVLIGDIGNDVLNGGLGDDTHIGGQGDDRINAGEGDDFADGGEGVDQINLEDGNDTGVGGLGADTIHAGAGQDVVYGDLGNVLNNGDYGADPHAGIGFSFLGQEGDWQGGGENVDDDNVQTRSVMQTMETTAGETYSMNFDLALGSLAAQGAAVVEVYWNGELVDSISPDSALFQQYNVTVTGTGGEDTLEFREIIELDSVAVGQDVYTTDAQLVIGGETIDVAGFTAGQSNLYQVINDQLLIFDTETKSYEAIGDEFGFKVNAAGFNAGDNLIYGFATQGGTDSNGQSVSQHDLVAIDAEGQIFRLGSADFASEFGGGNVYIGDFGPDGYLYVMNGGHKSELFKVDVNNIGPNGEVSFESIPMEPNSNVAIADWAWVDSEQAFVGVSSGGTVHTIDPISLADGYATVSSTTIKTTIVDGEEISGHPSGSAWGAVFTDADGNLYAGLNNGDHDVDGSTANAGGIYQITDFTGDDVQAVLLSEAPATGSNDGISDPRSLSTFAETDGDASVLIKNISLTGATGDDDLITGGTGDDIIFGEGGGDTIHGQEGDDRIDGGVGDDTLFGESGDDFIYGGEGADHVEGGAGADQLSGNVGDDTLMGGAGGDTLDGGVGNDKVVGGAGEDTITGGAGDDHLWGGEWSADGETDTFVFAPGSGQDMIHDFETGSDVIDLSAYGLTWNELEPAIQDHGWAVSIELGAVGGQDGDRIFLTNVNSDEISSDNFDLGE